MRICGVLLSMSLCLATATQSAEDVWNYCSSTWFTSRGYSYPFDQGAYDGVNLAMKGFSCTGEYRKTWEIYDVSLGDIRKGIPPPNGNHYFSLYNHSLGVLRTFFFVEANKAPNGQKHSINLEVTKSGVPYKGHSHFSFSGVASNFTIAENAAANAAPPSYFINSSKNQKWLVTDTYLSYDPTDYGARFPGEGLALNFVAQTHKQSEITLNGKITPVTQAMSVNPKVKIFNAAKTAATWDYQGYKMDWEDLADKFGGVATYAENMGMASVGRALGELGTKIALNPSILTASLAASGLVTSFFTSSSGSTNVGFPPSTISLDGAITSTDPLFNASIPLASSSAFHDRRIPTFVKRNPDMEERRLGQHNITSRPKAKIYVIRKLLKHDVNGYFMRAYEAYVDVQDLRCQLMMNPVSGAKVKNVQVMVSGGTFSSDVTTSGRYSSYFPNPPPLHGRFVNPQNPNLHSMGKFFIRNDTERSWRYLNGTDVYPPRPSPLLNKKIFGEIRVRALYTFQTSPTDTMDVLKTFTVDMEPHIEMLNPLLTSASWNTASLASLQAVLDIDLVKANHQGCPYEDPVLEKVVNYADGTVKVTYEGEANWYKRNSGVLASGYIGPNQKSSMVIKFKGEEYNFSWACSSELNNDVLEWWDNSKRVNGKYPLVKRGTIHGETPWEYKQMLNLDSREITVKFVYRKNGTKVAGQDKCFVDNFLAD